METRTHIAKRKEYIPALGEVICFLEPFFVFRVFALAPFCDMGIMLDKLQSYLVGRFALPSLPVEMTAMGVGCRVLRSTIDSTTSLKGVFGVLYGRN